MWCVGVVSTKVGGVHPTFYSSWGVQKRKQELYGPLRNKLQLEKLQQHSASCMLGKSSLTEEPEVS